ALPRDRLNKAIAVPIVPQSLAQDKNVLAEIALFDKALRPERRYQLSSLEDLPAVLNQERKGIEHLGCKGYRLAVAHQYPLRQIELESAELVDHARFPLTSRYVKVRSKMGSFVPLDYTDFCTSVKKAETCIVKRPPDTLSSHPGW